MRRVTKKFGFREVNDDEDFILYWTDYSVSLERVMEMKKYQVSCIWFYNLTEDSKTRQYRIPPLLLVNRTFPAGFP